MATDLYIIGIVTILVIVVDLIGLAMRMGIFHLAGGLLQTWNLAAVASTSQVTYVSGGVTQTLSKTDFNTVMVMLVVTIIVSFLFIFYLKRFA